MGLVKGRESVCERLCGSWQGLDPVYLALSRLRRRKFDDSIQVSTELLGRNAVDQQVQFPRKRGWTEETQEIYADVL